MFLTFIHVSYLSICRIEAIPSDWMTAPFDQCFFPMAPPNWLEDAELYAGKRGKAQASHLLSAEPGGFDVDDAVNLMPRFFFLLLQISSFIRCLEKTLGMLSIKFFFGSKSSTT